MSKKDRTKYLIKNKQSNQSVDKLAMKISQTLYSNFFLILLIELVLVTICKTVNYCLSFLIKFHLILN